MFIKQTGIWQIEKELRIIKKGFHQRRGQNHLAGLEKLNYGEESPFQTDPLWGGLKGLEADDNSQIVPLDLKTLTWKQVKVMTIRKVWGLWKKQLLCSHSLSASSQG